MSDDVELRMAWDGIAPATSRSREVFDDLVGRHRQAHRRYHGLRHVVWVLRHARQLQAEIAECREGAATYDGAAVAAAAFFHDAVYDPRAGDNEERSAVLAGHQLASLGWEPARCDIVAALVRATAGHLSDEAADEVSSPGGAAGPDDRREPTAVERHVLLDADLAVLGSEPNAYAAYVNGVRFEYGHLSAEEWATGRSAVVRRLLDRDHLYGSAPARTWWEGRARANLASELAELGR